MKILGLEKLSLVDFDGRIAATVFTGGCNFRCPFCHNGPLVLDAAGHGEIAEKDFFDYLDKRKGVLQGVCVTGGEPTLMPDLGEFLSEVKARGLETKLDSNGTSPAVLSALIEKKLVDYVAMDVKNSPERYAATAGIESPDLKRVDESIRLLKKGLVAYEFRTTLVAEFHGEEEIEAIGKWIEGAERYFLQAYKETENCIETGFTKVPEDRAARFLEIAARHVKRAALRGY